MLTKKAAPKKLATLSEKEIQERLYGFYHKSDMVGEPRPKDPSKSFSSSPQSVAVPVAQPAQPAYSVPVQPSNPSVSRELFPSSEIQQTGVRDVKPKFQQAPLTSKLQPVTTPKEPGIQQVVLERSKVFFEALILLLKKVPLQYYVIAGSAIVLVFVFFQLVTLGFKKMNAAHPRPQTASLQGPAVAEKSPAAPSIEKATRPSETTPVPAPASVIPPSEPPAPLATKSYTVQLCLSDNLDASQVLIDTLKTKGYEAYFRKVKGSRGNELFQIFVGRYPSSAEAQSTLKALRKDAEFKNYDDSFVRTA